MSYGKPYTDAEIAAGLENPSPRMLATVRRLLRERDAAQVRVKALEWQVANWEHKETQRASCCDANEQRANELEAAHAQLTPLHSAIHGHVVWLLALGLSPTERSWQTCTRVVQPRLDHYEDAP